MELDVGFFELARLGAKLVNHKYDQYRRRTNEIIERDTKYGKIKGVKRKTIYDADFYAFEGIPFAKPPVGELRFRAPQPPEPWKGVRDCTNVAYKPAQKSDIVNFKEGSEDCLYLNVYVKKLESEKPLPVMVWIHGGGFYTGEASRDVYAPDYFMEKDIVFVAITYRLGALGFLSLQDPDLDVPGNAGLKDQLLALRWVKDNIANFNGDADNITLFGESAGGASTQYMMLTERAKGLFHKAIMQSGSVLCPFACLPQPNWAYRLAQKIGYKGTNNDKEVFRFLSSVNPMRLVGADKELLTRQEKFENYFTAIGPVIEPYITEDCIIPKAPVEMLKTAWGNNIPLILGGTSFEGLIFYVNVLREPFKINDAGDCSIVLPDAVRATHDESELKEMGLKLKRAYFGEKEPKMPDTFLEYLDLLSIRHFWHAIHRTKLARLAYAPHAPTYLYRFDFDSPHFNHYRILKCGKGQRGVCHADDISYFFYNIAAYKLPKDSPEYNTIVRCIDMWTSFAATSNPNCEAIKPAIWEPVRIAAKVGNGLDDANDDEDTSSKCLNISEKVEFMVLPEKHLLELWDSFYTKLPLY